MAIEPVVVHLLGREYRVNCPPEERQQLMAAAVHLDQQMREIRDQGKVTSLEKIAVMAALNLSDTLLRLKSRRRGEENVGQHLEALTRRLGEVLES